MLFLLVVAGSTALTFREPGLPTRQANLLAEVFKARHPAEGQLYANDPVFAEGGRGAPWRLHLPAWRALLGAAERVVAPADPVNAFRLLGAALVLIYLLSMYVLLYRQTLSALTSMLVALMSLAVYSSRPPYWGIGPVFTVTPAAVYLAVVPVLMLLFVSARGVWALAGVFFLVGAAGNVHISSAANLAIVLALALLVRERFRPRAWMAVGLGALAAAAGAGPALYYYYRTFQAAGLALPAAASADPAAAMELSGLNLLYPGVAVFAVRRLAVALVPVVLAVIVPARPGRRRTTGRGQWLTLLAVIFVVAFGLHGLAQLAGRVLGTWPVATELFGAFGLVMVPVYVLFARAMVDLLRLARRNRRWLEAALVAVAVVYLGFSWNAHPLRRLAQELVSAAGGRVPSRSERASARELRAVGRWARLRSRPESLFITDRAEVRAYAIRSISCSRLDVEYLYRLGPRRLAGWQRRLRRQRRLLNPDPGALADAEDIVRLADDWRGRLRVPGAAIYVLLRTRSAPRPAGRLVAVDAPGGAWGRHWCLFQVLPPEPGSQAALTGPAGAATMPAGRVSSSSSPASTGP